MKITQMKFQRIVVKTLVIFAAISVFYSLMFATQLYGFNSIMNEAGDKGYELWESVQDFNKLLFKLTVAYLIVSLSLLVFFTQSRRKYYISNYIVTGVTAVFGIALSIYALVGIIGAMSTYVSIDFESIIAYASARNLSGLSSTPWSFIIGIIVFFVDIVLCGAVVFNAVWKFKAMKLEEAQFGEIDAQIRADWQKREDELAKEAEKYES